MNRLCVLICALISLTSCITPEYRHVENGNTEAMKAQDVNYKIHGLFYRDPPDCVSVMATQSDKNPEMAKMLSVALARHLGEKVDRVIFPRKRQSIARENGFDLSNKGDLRRYSLRTKCRFYARAELYDLGDEYIGIFAEKHVGVRLEIARIEDNQPLWQAAHTVWRADGGVPLSPFSAIGGVASATMFKNNGDIMPSLVDDAMRRMIHTLPPSI